MAPKQLEVKAKENSITGGLALDTGITVAKGDRLIVTAAEDDTWACGEGDLTSNANGLVAGNKYGGVYGSMAAPTSGGAFPYGSLVGSLDGGKSYFLVGTKFDAPVPQAGTLSLCFWDGNAEDNTGSVRVSVDTVPAAAPIPANAAQPAVTAFPVGTKWSVAAFNDAGALGGFHAVPWEFQEGKFNAGELWSGVHRPLPGCDIGLSCEIINKGSSTPADSFAVYFVTPTRFIATKNGSLYRFGKKTAPVETLPAAAAIPANSGQPAATSCTAGGKWSVAAFNDAGALGGFHAVPWEFQEGKMNAGELWLGAHKPLPGCDIGLSCEITHKGHSAPTDLFKVYFVTPTRFVATKDGSLYRFGKTI